MSHRNIQEAMSNIHHPITVRQGRQCLGTNTDDYGKVSNEQSLLWDSPKKQYCEKCQNRLMQLKKQALGMMIAYRTQELKGIRLQESSPTVVIYEQLHVPEYGRKSLLEDRCDVCFTHCTQLKNEVVAMVQSLELASEKGSGGTYRPPPKLPTSLHDSLYLNTYYHVNQHHSQQGDALPLSVKIPSAAGTRAYGVHNGNVNGIARVLPSPELQHSLLPAASGQRMFRPDGGTTFSDKTTTYFDTVPPPVAQEAQNYLEENIQAWIRPKQSQHTLPVAGENGHTTCIQQLRSSVVPDLAVSEATMTASARSNHSHIQTNYDRVHSSQNYPRPMSPVCPVVNVGSEGCELMAQSSFLPHSLSYSGFTQPTGLQVASYSSPLRIIPGMAQPSAAASFFARASQRLNLSSKKKKRCYGNHELESSPSFVTNFYDIIRSSPPPIPPGLLRVTAKKDGVCIGKVKVMLRISPVSEDRNGTKESSFLTVDTRKKQVTLYDPSSCCQSAPLDRQVGVAAPKMFAFDAIFEPNDTQVEVCCSSLTEVIQAVVNGNDGCLFVYGHSKLGKTYTMLGESTSVQELGTIPCAISWLFKLINQQKEKTGARFSVRASAVEIAGRSETLTDLLRDYATSTEGSGTSPGVLLKDDPVYGTHLMNQSEVRAPTAEKTAYILDAAIAAQNNCETTEERRDSHFMFTLHVYQYRVQKGNKSGVVGGRSRLHMIDLGSCENHLKPRDGLNGQSLSLSSLGNVIIAIFNGQKHVPHKDSKLTQLLREAMSSLTCRAAMVAHVSKSPEQYAETLSTIQLASRIHRMRRKKLKYQGASSSESSSDDRGTCHPFIKGHTVNEDVMKSSSDPDCTSSSEQSCDTVIFIGERSQGLQNKNIKSHSSSPPSHKKMDKPVNTSIDVTKIPQATSISQGSRKCSASSTGLNNDQDTLTQQWYKQNSLQTSTQIQPLAKLVSNNSDLNSGYHQMPSKHCSLSMTPHSGFQVSFLKLMKNPVSEDLDHSALKAQCSSPKDLSLYCPEQISYSNQQTVLQLPRKLPVKYKINISKKERTNLCSFSGYTPNKQNAYRDSIVESDELWIDGPRFLKPKIESKSFRSFRKEQWIDGPGVYGFADDFKKNMIKKWVEDHSRHVQHVNEMNCEVWVDFPSEESSELNKCFNDYKKGYNLVEDNQNCDHKDHNQCFSAFKWMNESRLSIADEINSAKREEKNPTDVDNQIDKPLEKTTEYSVPVHHDSFNDNKREENGCSGYRNFRDSRLSDDGNFQLVSEPETLNTRGIEENLSLEMLNKTSDIVKEHKVCEITEKGESLDKKDQGKAVQVQDSCLQVNEEDILDYILCDSSVSETLTLEMDQESLDGNQHPLSILSKEDLNLPSSFTDSQSVSVDLDNISIFDRGEEELSHPVGNMMWCHLQQNIFQCELEKQRKKTENLPFSVHSDILTDKLKRLAYLQDISLCLCSEKNVPSDSYSLPDHVIQSSFSNKLCNKKKVSKSDLQNADIISTLSEPADLHFFKLNMKPMNVLKLEASYTKRFETSKKWRPTQVVMPMIHSLREKSASLTDLEMIDLQKMSKSQEQMSKLQFLHAFPKQSLTCKQRELQPNVIRNLSHPDGSSNSELNNRASLYESFSLKIPGQQYISSSKPIIEEFKKEPSCLMDKNKDVIFTNKLPQNISKDLKQASDKTELDFQNQHTNHQEECTDTYFSNTSSVLEFAKKHHINSKCLLKSEKHIKDAPQSASSLVHIEESKCSGTSMKTELLHLHEEYKNSISFQPPYKPKTNLQSPYAKITKARPNKHASSGCGSDSSIQSTEYSKNIPVSKKLQFCGTSSGYESMMRDSEGTLVSSQESAEEGDTSEKQVRSESKTRAQGSSHRSQSAHVCSTSKKKTSQSLMSQLITKQPLASGTVSQYHSNGLWKLEEEMCCSGLLCCGVGFRHIATDITHV
ncbi:uncharacterized protein LOC143222996 [Tachypleus tridentatus]|uniref:uncharacterized protein LOC143222996 n=1 Tax=Tachypleus tridentatus TaxID=6853 RepID=UPI003FD2986D